MHKMHLRNVRKFLLCVTCAFINLVAFSQGENTQQRGKNAFMSSWDVAVLGVRTDNFDAMSSAVRKTALFLNSLLDDAVKSVPTHKMNPEEHVKAKERLRVKALASLQKQLSEAITKHESAVLSDNNKSAWATRAKEKKTLDELKKKIKKIEALKVADIPLESTLPVKFIEQSTYMWAKRTQDLQAIADELSADALLYFTLNELEDGYIIITLYDYNAIAEEKQQVMQTIMHEEKVALIQDGLQKAINTHILGAPAAALRIEVAIDSEESTWRSRVEDAPILVDGNVVGFGSVDLRVIEVGSHAVMVSFQGQQRTLLVELKEGDEALRRVLFNADAENTVTLLSEPAGARVYVNSQWMGNTPMVLSRPVGDLADQVELRLAEHEDTRLTINSVAPATMSATLKPIYAVPLKDRLKQRRNRFYTAFAVFGASLIPPIVLNSLYTGENAALLAANKNKQVSRQSLIESDERRQAYYYSYIGTAVLSAGMSIYAFVELIFYLRTASEYHDR